MAEGCRGEDCRCSIVVQQKFEVILKIIVGPRWFSEALSYF